MTWASNFITSARQWDEVAEKSEKTSEVYLFNNQCQGAFTTWTRFRAHSSTLTSMPSSGESMWEAGHESNHITGDVSVRLEERQHFRGDSEVETPAEAKCETNNWPRMDACIIEVPKDVRNSKVRKQDTFRRDWSQHLNTCKSLSRTEQGVRRSKRPLLAYSKEVIERCRQRSVEHHQTKQQEIGMKMK